VISLGGRIALASFHFPRLVKCPSPQLRSLLAFSCFHSDLRTLFFLNVSFGASLLCLPLPEFEPAQAVDAGVAACVAFGAAADVEGVA